MCHTSGRRKSNNMATASKHVNQEEINATSAQAAAQGVPPHIIKMWQARTVTGSELCLATFCMAQGVRFVESTDEYRRNPAISNSDLNAFVREQLGEEPQSPTRAMAVGTAIHGILLEKRSLSDYCFMRESEKALASSIIRKVTEKYGYLMEKSKHIQHEQPFYKEIITHVGAIKVKCLVDIVRTTRAGHKHLFDIKTTRAETEEQFLEAIEAYRYAQQGAYYLDITGASSFTLIGVSKTNGEIFEVTFKPQSREIRKARTEYMSVLRRMVSHFNNIAV